MRSQGTRVTPLSVAVSLVASVLIFMSFAGYLAPHSVHANHSQGSNCLHQHPIAGNPLRSQCLAQKNDADPALSLFGSVPAGETCLIQGETGTCRQGGTACICKIRRLEEQEISINRLNTVMGAALMFSGVAAAVGQAAACNQLRTLVNDLLLTKSGLESLRPISIYDPNMLRQLDFVVINLSQLGSFGSRCDIQVPVAEALEVFQQMKQEMLASFPLLFLIE